MFQWVNRDEVTMWHGGVMALMRKSDVAIEDYEVLDWVEFKRWNQKRKRGFYYDKLYVKEAIKLMLLLELVDFSFLVPSEFGPLLIQDVVVTIAIAPKISFNDKRLRPEFRAELRKACKGISDNV